MRVFRRKFSSVLVAWLLLAWSLWRGSQYLMEESYTQAAIYGVLMLFTAWLLIHMWRNPELTMTEAGLTITNGPFAPPTEVRWAEVRRVERLNGSSLALVTETDRIEVSLRPFSDTDRNNIVALLHQRVGNRAPA